VKAINITKINQAVAIYLQKNQILEIIFLEIEFFSTIFFVSIFFSFASSTSISSKNTGSSISCHTKSTDDSETTSVSEIHL